MHAGCADEALAAALNKPLGLSYRFLHVDGVNANTKHIRDRQSVLLFITH